MHYYKNIEGISKAQDLILLTIKQTRQLAEFYREKDITADF